MKNRKFFPQPAGVERMRSTGDQGWSPRACAEQESTAQCCGKNFLFFTPRNTYVRPGMAPDGMKCLYSTWASGVLYGNGRRVIQSAHNDIDAMRNAKTSLGMRTAWIAFLIDLNRSYNKAYAELSAISKFKGWTERGRLKALRASDPLLA
jgi:hypothetical protein